MLREAGIHPHLKLFGRAILREINAHGSNAA
jgi:hypothetical protein